MITAASGSLQPEALAEPALFCGSAAPARLVSVIRREFKKCRVVNSHSDWPPLLVDVCVPACLYGGQACGVDHSTNVRVTCFQTGHQNFYRIACFDLADSGLSRLATIDPKETFANVWLRGGV